MVSSPRTSIGGIAIAAALFAAGALGFPGSAGATPAWLRNVLSGGHAQDGRTPPAPQIARYQIEEGDAFVLDRSSRPPLLKFESSPEVWALTASHGPRGDVLYSDDVGNLLIRSTKLGGLTVYTPDRPEGAAAAVTGAANPIRLTQVPVFVLYERFVQYSARSSHLARHTMGFEAPDTDAHSVPLIADAAVNAVEAISSLPGRPGGKLTLTRIGKVIFFVANQPAAGLQHGALVINVAPSQGFAGRPSSARILMAIGAPLSVSP